ncbi:MAG: WG repeat-containing protein [Bacteroidaceae bacterium]|nr:WG repeat-containing protein [Bacteroidaceae bacterium]
MNRRFILPIIGIFILLICACGSKDNASRPQWGYLLAFTDDSCYCIGYNDQPLFAQPFTNTSLYYNDIASVQSRDGKWGFINRKGEFRLPAVYEKATVFSEGMAWVIKKGNMPSAINEKGDVKISLRETICVRVFHEGHAAYCANKKNIRLWGFLDKNGNETIKAQYRDVKDFHMGLAAVQENAGGLWGYINLKGELVIPHQYPEASSFNDEGTALVKSDEQHLVINREGTVLQKLPYKKATPDGMWNCVKNEQGWGWCNDKGEVAVTPQFEEVRPFGKADLAPVKIRGKWGYVDRKGKVTIKRQFTEAYPFIEGRAAVKVGIVWGFIDEKGVFIVNPQYEYIPQDYLYQALGIGTALSTLHIE